MDKSTLRQTIIAGVVSIIISLRILGVLVFATPIFDVIFAILLIAAMYFAWGYCSHWKNNDFTQGAKVATKVGRKANKEAKKGDATLYDKLNYASGGVE